MEVGAEAARQGGGCLSHLGILQFCQSTTASPFIHRIIRHLVARKPFMSTLVESTLPTLEVVVMAAGKGTRMKSRLPKVLQKLGGKPLLGHVLATA